MGWPFVPAGAGVLWHQHPPTGRLFPLFWVQGRNPAAQHCFAMYKCAFGHPWSWFRGLRWFYWGCHFLAQKLFTSHIGSTLPKLGDTGEKSGRFNTQSRAALWARTEQMISPFAVRMPRRSRAVASTPKCTVGCRSRPCAFRPGGRFWHQYLFGPAGHYTPMPTTLTIPPAFPSGSSPCSFSRTVRIQISAW